MKKDVIVDLHSKHLSHYNWHSFKVVWVVFFLIDKLNQN